MSLKDECIKSLNDTFADVKADKKGKKEGLISIGDSANPNHQIVVYLDTKKNDVCIVSPPPAANCVQVSFDTHEDHWSWKALHAALFY